MGAQFIQHLLLSVGKQNIIQLYRETQQIEFLPQIQLTASLGLPLVPKISRPGSSPGFQQQIRESHHDRGTDL